jgi:Phage integrase, N-terminal SAM-like domain
LGRQRKTRGSGEEAATRETYKPQEVPHRPADLPELDQTKRSVLNSLTSLQSRRSYQQAVDEFIEWYCSEPRLALNRAIVLRYRLQLEAKKLAASTINVRLAAVRRLAYEAADNGLLSPELVAGIRRAKGVPQLGQPWTQSAVRLREHLVSLKLMADTGKDMNVQELFALG